MKEVKRVWKNGTTVSLYMKKNKIQIGVGGDICFFLSDPISSLPHPAFSLGPGHLAALLLCLHCDVCHSDLSSLPHDSWPTCSLSAAWGHREPVTETPVPCLGRNIPACLPGSDFFLRSLTYLLLLHWSIAHSHLGTWIAVSSPHWSVNRKRGFSASLVHAVFSGLGAVAGTQNIFVLINVSVEITQLRCGENKVWCILWFLIVFLGTPRYYI